VTAKRAIPRKSSITDKRAIINKSPTRTKRLNHEKNTNMNEATRIRLRRAVRSFYDLQRLRIQTGNRDSDRAELTDDDRQFMSAQSDGLETLEKLALKEISAILKGIPIYKWLKQQKGCGPTMSGVLLAEIDITRAETCSSIWKYAGLDVDTRTGKARRGEKGVKRCWNSFLKTKVVGVLGSCMLKANSPWRKCYDAKTEVLTETGWISFPEYGRKWKDGERVAVAVFDPQRDGFFFETPSDYIERQHTGGMYCIEQRFMSMRVTDDHDLWVQSWNRPNWRFAKPNQMVGKQYIARIAARFVGQEKAPKPAPVPTWNPEAWAAFLGYYISEGCLRDGRKHGTGSSISISQLPTTAGPILMAIAELGYEPSVQAHPESGVLVITIHNTELTRYLEQLGIGAANKKLPSDCFTWPTHLRQVLLDALMWGDGTLYNGFRTYSTVSKGLANDVQRLIATFGRYTSIKVSPPSEPPHSFRGNHPVYRIREGQLTLARLNNNYKSHDWIEPVENEHVYCVSVSTRLLMIRREGKVMVGANCYDDYKHRKQSQMVPKCMACDGTGKSTYADDSETPIEHERTNKPTSEKRAERVKKSGNGKRASVAEKTDFVERAAEIESPKSAKTEPKPRKCSNCNGTGGPAPWGRSDKHRHMAANRFMCKQFLLAFWKEWRTLEGLPTPDPYSEAKLGIKHGQHASHVTQDNRMSKASLRGEENLDDEASPTG